MRLLFLCLHPDAASSRLRIIELAPHLEALGVRCDVQRYPSGPWDRYSLTRRVEEYDAVVIQKRLPSWIEERLWRATPPVRIYDFDDALPYRQRPRRGSYESFSRRSRFERAKRLATAFACGNRYLAALVADTKKPVEILPTAVPIDVPRRVHSGRSASDPLRVGWIGNRGNLSDLDELAETFVELGKEHRLEVVVVSDAPWEVPGVPTRHVPWTKAGQASALAELDVGVMPLADTPWNRGKCSYKLLQYMAAGVCAVGSSVGMNADLIVDGENGLLAASPDEWTTKLRRALADSALRERLGAAGRATVECDYSFPAVAQRWLGFLERLVGHP